MASQIKLAPFRSFMDVPFFTRLSDLKLNQFKLDSNSVPLYGSYALPIALDITPTISFSTNSFEEVLDTEAAPVRYLAKGSLHNVNTIEEFNKVDRNRILELEGDAVSESIQNGEALKDPSLLVRTLMVSYSDLKKYVFHYWMAFPAFVVDYKVLGQGPGDLEVTQCYKEWIKHIEYHQRGFYLLKQRASTWVLGQLSEHETFFEQNDPICVGYQDPSTVSNVIGWNVRNFLALLGTMGYNKVSLYCHRDHTHLNHAESRSFWVDLEIKTDLSKEVPKITGWERDRNNKTTARAADLNSLLNPYQRADQSVNLNLKLMKWRVAPELDLDRIQHQSCLLLGAGTLGTYIARGLLGWGVKKITFVDNGKVSFSNPVRQPLYTFKDCLDGGVSKAGRAAEALKEIYPSVESEGHEMEIFMAGHPIAGNQEQAAMYQKLVELIDAHDVIFLLMDSRESRWLPTVISTALQKLVINVALGFDSSMVMRHGVIPNVGAPPHLGCYFCNDIVAPIDSLTNRTLDQMCTVTRPGIAMSASSQAVELFASIAQHPQGKHAPHSDSDDAVLSSVPHQLRTFLGKFETRAIRGQSFTHCSACSSAIINQWNEEGWEFVKRALNESGYVEELSGLKKLQQEAEQIDDSNMSASDED